MGQEKKEGEAWWIIRACQEVEDAIKTEKDSRSCM